MTWRSRRRRPHRLPAVVLVTCLVTAGALTGCGGDRPPVAPPDPPRRAASLTPPRAGALFGAYVDPPIYDENHRIRAVQGFEQRLGRRIALYHDYHPWADPFPSRSDRYFAERGTTLLLSWGGTDTRAIASGQDDSIIRARAEAVAALGRPVLLRWRWEMNRPNLADEIGSGDDYVAAWRHLHDVFASVGADNVAWVWCPLADERADSDFAAYYPGDEYVDWLCVDGYARSESQSFADVFEPFLMWAAGHAKPVVIGEFGRSAATPGDRAAWLDAARRFVEATPQIKAVSVFESARGASGDYAVADDPDSLAALRRWTHDPYFDPH